MPRGMYDYMRASSLFAAVDNMMIMALTLLQTFDAFTLKMISHRVKVISQSHIDIIHKGFIGMFSFLDMAVVCSLRQVSRHYDDDTLSLFFVYAFRGVRVEWLVIKRQLSRNWDADAAFLNEFGDCILQQWG